MLDSSQIYPYMLVLKCTLCRHTVCMGTVDIRKVFGKNVKHYRKKAGLSQEQLAEKLDISPNHMSVIETGGKFVTYKLLERIVETFGIMPAALFFMPGTAPFDDTAQNKVNTIIKEELDSAGVEIAKRIAQLQGEEMAEVK